MRIHQNLRLHVTLTKFKVRDSVYRVAMTSVPLFYLLGMRLLQTLILLSVRVQLSSGELSLGPRDTYGEWNDMGNVHFASEVQKPNVAWVKFAGIQTASWLSNQLYAIGHHHQPNHYGHHHQPNHYGSWMLFVITNLAGLSVVFSCGNNAKLLISLKKMVARWPFGSSQATGRTLISRF